MAAIHHPKPEVVLSQPWIEVRSPPMFFSDYDEIWYANRFPPS